MTKVAIPTLPLEEVFAHLSPLQQEHKPTYELMLLNDDFTKAGFVVAILRSLFAQSEGEAITNTMAIHNNGFLPVFRGSLYACVEKQQYLAEANYLHGANLNSKLIRLD